MWRKHAGWQLTAAAHIPACFYTAVVRIPGGMQVITALMHTLVFLWCVFPQDHLKTTLSNEGLLFKVIIPLAHRHTVILCGQGRGCCDRAWPHWREPAHQHPRTSSCTPIHVHATMCTNELIQCQPEKSTHCTKIYMCCYVNCSCITHTY